MEPINLEPQPAETGPNWKLLVPLGCLGVMVLSVGCCGGLLGFVFYSLHNSWAYSEGVKLAKLNPEVVAELGEPIESGWLATGSINVTNDSGDAHVAISLSGSKQNGTLYVVAHKQAGQWDFKSVIVETGGGKKIDLLKGRN
jgi:hypothetical protein